MPSGLALDFIARVVGGYFALFYFVLPECSPLGKETLFYNRKGNKTDRTAWHFAHRKMYARILMWLVTMGWGSD